VNHAKWIEPAEGFRMILRVKRPNNPGLADQIISTAWFHYPKMQAEKHSSADFDAAQEAFHVFLREYRAGRIRSRGILNGAGPIDIDPTDAKTGSLSVFARELDCSSVVRGRVFRNVFVDKASVRKAITAAVGPASKPREKPASDADLAGFMKNYKGPLTEGALAKALQIAGVNVTRARLRAALPNRRRGRPNKSPE
jgi:hypothetical protein